MGRDAADAGTAQGKRGYLGEGWRFKAGLFLEKIIYKRYEKEDKYVILGI